MIQLSVYDEICCKSSHVHSDDPFRVNDYWLTLKPILTSFNIEDIQALLLILWDTRAGNIRMKGKQILCLLYSFNRAGGFLYTRQMLSEKEWFTWRTTSMLCFNIWWCKCHVSRHYKMKEGSKTLLLFQHHWVYENYYNFVLVNCLERRSLNEAERDKCTPGGL